MKLLIHDINMLGDTLMSSPVYKAFKDSGHEVHSLGSPYQRELLEGNPYIDKIWTPKNQWKIIPQLRAEKYQYVLQLNTSFKTNLFLSTLNSVSIGYSYKFKGLPLDIKIPIDRPTCREGNRIEEIDDLIFQAFGLRLEPKMIYERFFVGYDAHNLKWVAISPFCGRHFKERMWDFDKWNVVMNRLKGMGYEVYVVGGKENYKQAQDLLYWSGNNWVNNLCGYELEYVAEFLRECRLLITVNSFPMHLGISQGTPTLALVGRTPVEVIVHPSVTNFWALEDPAIHDKSLKPMNFTVEEVLSKVKEALK